MMDKDDVVAALALKALDKEMRLRKTVTEPAYAYCCRGGILGVALGTLAMCCVIWMLIKDNMPVWGFMLFGLAMTGLLESVRQRERLNALVELMEIEKNKTKANGIGLPIAEEPSRPTGHTDRVFGESAVSGTRYPHGHHAPS
jgi:hypothetical protein